MLTRLYAAPLAVNGLIRTHLLAGRSGVLTSATLALGGSFDPIARAVGLEVRPDAEPVGPPRWPGRRPPRPRRQPWRGLDVGSPFDYRRQGILYLARHLPPAGPRAGHRGPARRDRRRSSRRRAAAPSACSRRGVRPTRPRPPCASASTSRSSCRATTSCRPSSSQFIADEPTCLFGTLSLWQGVDVPGADVPARPHRPHPVPAARRPGAARPAPTRSRPAGGNGFLAVSATHAALLLAQGAGRLIRTSEDRGVVAVLDPRLRPPATASFLTRSLPDFWRTTDRAVAVSALRRLATCRIASRQPIRTE